MAEKTNTENENDKRIFIAYDADLYDKEEKLVALTGEKGSILKYTGRYPKDAANKMASRGFKNILIRETNNRITLRKFKGSIEEIEIPEEKMTSWMKVSPKAEPNADGVLTIKVKKGVTKYQKPVIKVPKGTRLLEVE